MKSILLFYFWKCGLRRSGPSLNCHEPKMVAEYLNNNESPRRYQNTWIIMIYLLSCPCSTRPKCVDWACCSTGRGSASRASGRCATTARHCRRCWRSTPPTLGASPPSWPAAPGGHWMSPCCPSTRRGWSAWSRCVSQCPFHPCLLVHDAEYSVHPTAESYSGSSHIKST